MERIDRLLAACDILYSFVWRCLEWSNQLW